MVLRQASATNPPKIIKGINENERLSSSKKILGFSFLWWQCSILYFYVCYSTPAPRVVDLYINFVPNFTTKTILCSKMSHNTFCELKNYIIQYIAM
jgi:hypothetical protein